MPSVESKRHDNYDNLIYLKPRLQARDLLDYPLEYGLSKLAKIETDGTEANIPQKGKLVIAYMPHTGFEPPFLEGSLLRRRKSPAVWVTKEESRELPKVILSPRRIVYVKRENPGPSTRRAIDRVLKTPNGTIGSALEGTRYSNPEIIDDVLTLGEAQTGLMRIAYESHTRIMGVAVLGPENILPGLDDIVKNESKTKALKLIAHALAHPKEVRVRFLPPYEGHLDEAGFGLKGEKKREFIEEHNKRFTGQLVEEILKLEPDYPLGYYRK